MKNVAIVGAGASGITAIKCCVDEGLTPTCFERTADIGGLWNYTEAVRSGQACVMKSTVINTSKEMMCYSDFPIPEKYPMYMHNTHVKEYFNLYVDNFKLRQYIKFQSEIINIKPDSDFKNTGKWSINIKDKISGTTDTKIFDAVLICTGHHANINLPEFPGQNEFQGKILHSHDYKHPQGYEGKKVVVVGIGNSGGDVAVELSRTAKQAYLSTRRGAWIFSRIGNAGVPLDMQNATRYSSLVKSILPTKLRIKIEKDWLNRRFDHAAYRLQPVHSPDALHPTNNDDLPNRIICGSVIVKPNIKKFTKTGVEFDDGSFEDDIYAVIMATGYIFGFPFLDKSVIDIQNNQNKLYKYMFPPDRPKHTLAIIGYFQQLGALMPISEMQCRLATRVFKGEVMLPSNDKMWEDINMKRQALKGRYVQTLRHTMQVDFMDFMDQLAILNGNKPNLLKLALTDPKLAYHCYFGPCTPYQFRLHGPGKWEGAREAVLTTWERALKPLQTRPLGFKETKAGLPIYKICMFAILLAVLLKVLF